MGEPAVQQVVEVADLAFLVDGEGDAGFAGGAQALLDGLEVELVLVECRPRLSVTCMGPTSSSAHSYTAPLRACWILRTALLHLRGDGLAG
jgi:hypothetical protein